MAGPKLPFDVARELSKQLLVLSESIKSAYTALDVAKNKLDESTRLVNTAYQNCWEMSYIIRSNLYLLTDQDASAMDSDQSDPAESVLSETEDGLPAHIYDQLIATCVSTGRNKRPHPDAESPLYQIRQDDDDAVDRTRHDAYYEAEPPLSGSAARPRTHSGGHDGGRYVATCRRPGASRERRNQDRHGRQSRRSFDSPRASAAAAGPPSTRVSRSQPSPRLSTPRHLLRDHAPLHKRQKVATERDYVTVSPRYTPESPRYNPVYPSYKPVSPRYVPVSPGYAPASPRFKPVSPRFKPKSPFFKPASPKYAPASRNFVLVSPNYAPASPNYVLVSPDYVPASPDPQPHVYGIYDRRDNEGDIAPNTAPQMLPGPCSPTGLHAARSPSPFDGPHSAPAVMYEHHPLLEPLQLLPPAESVGTSAALDLEERRRMRYWWMCKKTSPPLSGNEPKAGARVDEQHSPPVRRPASVSGRQRGKSRAL